MGDTAEKKSFWSRRKHNPDKIDQSIGTFGVWHLWIAMWLVSMRLPVIWHQIIFLAISAPTNATCEDVNYDPCDKYCTKRIYKNEYFDSTVISEWDLSCNNRYLVDLLQTTVMAGVLFGNLSFGFWADKMGRKLPLIVGVGLQIVFGVASAFVPWLWAFFILKFLTNFAVGGAMLIHVVLLMELIGSKWRIVVLTINQIVLGLGYMFIALVAYLFDNWRYCQLSICIPAVVLLCYIWVIPESPRWLLTVDRKEKAVAIVAKAAKWNKKPIENVAPNIDDYVNAMKERTRKSGNFVDLYGSPTMTSKTIIIGFIWFICGLCYYGISQVVGGLSGNLYMNILYLGVCQIPAVILTIPFLEFIGRRPTLMASLAITGSAYLSMIFVPEGIPRMVCGVIAMSGIAAAFNVIYIYSSEIFPTIVRNIGCGSSSTIARIGSIIAPHIAGLSHYTAFWIPIVIMSSFPLLGLFTVIFLPETRAADHLPDTVAEADEYTWRGKREQPAE